MTYSESVIQILNNIQKNPKVLDGLKKWKANKKSVTYEKAQQYSKVLGDATASALEGYADKLDPLEIKQIYKAVTDIMINYCNDVAVVNNTKANIKYLPDVTNETKEDINEMLSNLVKRMQEEEDFEKVKFLTESNAAKSITRKSTTSHMKYTSRSQQRAGLNVTISRDEGSGCCDFCAGLTGTYTSFDDLPNDFWSVHRGCTCVFHYKVDKTQGKIHFETDEQGKINKITEEE